MNLRMPKGAIPKRLLLDLEWQVLLRTFGSIASEATP